MIVFTEDQKVIIAKLLAVQGVHVLLDDGIQVTNIMMERLFYGYLKDILNDDLIKNNVEYFDKSLKNEQQTK